MLAELIFNIFIAILVIFYLLYAFKLPATDNPTDVFGAGGFPIVIGIAALILIFFITLKVIREKKPVEIPMLNLALPEGRTVLLNVLLLGAYVGLLDILGFTVATVIYLFCATLSIGYRRVGVAAFFSILTTAILVLVFGRVFFVPLPRGIEFLRELSYYVY